jgi:tyrosine-protein kinase Etk/Wzc
MDTVRQDLMGVEKNLQGYREKNKIYSPEQQSQNYFNSLAELDNLITSKGVQLENINYLIRYINDSRNRNRQVVSLLNITEPTLLKQIGDFNDLQVQRETTLKTTTAENPLVRNLDAAIEKLRNDILQNLQNVKQSYTIELNNYQSKSAYAGKEVSLIPLKEKQLLDISRRQKILEELFSYLLQKKLETSISSASTISNIRVIEPASTSEEPVMPNRKGTFLIAFFLGLGLPAAVIFLKEFLNDKVQSREDIQKATTASIIGEVGHSEETNPLVVSRTSRRFIAEQFRIIRTNLEYFLPKSGKQIILVTSSTSGEGKSFMSANIGAVLALTGKKTVIMEFDIRKPKVASSLNIKHKSGISNFVIGKSEFDDIVVAVPSVDNLFVIPCGPIPPNPSELLVGEKIAELIEKAKERFDVIVIDTAPAGLVSDPIVLGRFANATIYVIRHNHTFKKQLNLLSEIHKNKRLPGLSLVVNDIVSDGTYGYHDGYTGYGYTGYGYGSEYFDDRIINKSFASKVKGIFKKSYSRK